MDKRCGINLDEIDPAQWKLLEAATDDYIAASKARFKQLTDILVAPHSSGMWESLSLSIGVTVLRCYSLWIALMLASEV